MALYSYKNQEPSILPSRVRLDNGSTRTSLNKLNVEELESLGFMGPITKPEFDEDTQKIEWSDGSYEIVALTEEDLAKKEVEERTKKFRNIDYNLFWEKLITSGVYKKLRNGASQSLQANTLCTELIALFGDAKVGNPNVTMLQHYMNVLFFNFNFTQEEVIELQTFMEETNLSVQYTLPDEKYLFSHTYNPETNIIEQPNPNDPNQANMPTLTWNEDNLEWELQTLDDYNK
jgi:hypothetical protein